MAPRFGDPYGRGAYWGGDAFCGGSIILEMAGEALARNGRGETGRGGGLKDAEAGAGDGAGTAEFVPKADRIGS